MEDATARLVGLFLIVRGAILNGGHPMDRELQTLLKDLNQQHVSVITWSPNVMAQRARKTMVGTPIRRFRAEASLAVRQARRRTEGALSHAEATRPASPSWSQSQLGDASKLRPESKSQDLSMASRT